MTVSFNLYNIIKQFNKKLNLLIIKKIYTIIKNNVITK